MNNVSVGTSTGGSMGMFGMPMFGGNSTNVNYSGTSDWLAAMMGGAGTLLGAYNISRSGRGYQFGC